MKKARENDNYFMDKNCERIEVTVGNLDVYLIQNREGIIIDVYPKGSEGDLVNTFTVWFEDAVQGD